MDWLLALVVLGAYFSGLYLGSQIHQERHPMSSMERKITPQLDIALANLLGLCAGIIDVLEHKDPWTPAARGHVISQLRAGIKLVTGATTPKVTIVRSDDWIAMYVDGELRAEGHKIPPELAARALGAELDLSLDGADIDRLIDKTGRYPGTLAALKAGKWDEPMQEVLQP